MMHVKAMMVDGAWSVIGSANFDNRSFELNDELTIAAPDPQLAAAAVIRDFEADMTKSKRLKPKIGASDRLWQKTRELFWSMFGELF